LTNVLVIAVSVQEVCAAHGLDHREETVARVTIAPYGATVARHWFHLSDLHIPEYAMNLLQLLSGVFVALCLWHSLS